MLVFKLINKPDGFNNYVIQIRDPVLNLEMYVRPLQAFQAIL